MTPPRLLVVDDNPAVRAVWCESLIALGYTVTDAEDGAAALAHFDAAPFDLVLTDLWMPGMDGWTLAEAIWNRSSVPVIVITGAAGDADLERARARSVVLLHKPVHLADFKRVIEQVLRGRQA
jgi:CheY-like chemotaxis protein